MSLLGCNSKTLWHEIFFQLVDIISVKQNKIGIIVCKNFHTINSELLEIFYSYMQQYNMKNSNILIKFIMELSIRFPLCSSFSRFFLAFSKSSAINEDSSSEVKIFLSLISG